ncbi:MAG: NlpC/P60 family protein [Pseudomonadota bacterium]
MTRDRIVHAARLWIGTPYHHQASLRGVGADCLGLVRGVWRDVCGAEPGAIPPYSPDWSEAAREERLWEAARAHLVEVDRPPTAGDVVLFRMRRGMVAKHLGIVTSRMIGGSFVHAYQGHGVIESPLSDPWRRRAVSFFEFPECEA